MPKNKHGCSGHKKTANKNANLGKGELIFCDDGQCYAVVDKVLGNAQFNVKCLMPDGSSEKKIALARARNKRKRGGWIKLDDIILISLRDFQPNKCDIIHSYGREEVLKLIQYKELTNKFCNFEEEDEDIAFEFTDLVENPSEKDKIIDNI